MKTKHMHKTPEGTALQLEDIADDLLERGRTLPLLEKDDYHSEGRAHTAHSDSLKLIKPHKDGYKTLTVTKEKNGAVSLQEHIHPHEKLTRWSRYEALGIHTEYNTDDGVKLDGYQLDYDEHGNLKHARSVEDLVKLRSEAGRIALEIQDELRVRADQG